MTDLGDIEEGRAHSLGSLPSDYRRRANLSTVQEETTSRELNDMSLSQIELGLTEQPSNVTSNSSTTSHHRGPENQLISPSASSDGMYDPSDTNHSGMSDSEMDATSEQGGQRVRISAPRFRSSSNRGMIRTKGRHDIQDGTRSLRESQRQHVQIRRTDTCGAMDATARRRKQWKKTLSIGKFNWLKGDDEEDEEGMKISMHGRLMVQPSKRILKDTSQNSSTPGSIPEEEEEEEERGGGEDEDEKRRAETQYRLTTVKRQRNRRMKIPGMYEDLATGEVTECCWICPCPNMNSDRVMSAFLHWSFRSPFLVVFGTAAVGWLSMTFVFAALIMLLGYFEPHCIGGVDFEASTQQFTDAYQLSWTTFSTVGYGLIYPATSATTNVTAVGRSPIHECTLITILTTFESFVGVLFSSLCAALMFAKVARVQSFAQVTFSDPIVIRYGTGVTANGQEEDDEEDENSHGDIQKDVKDPLGLKVPCPVLEFRIFNRMSSLQGGEIIDATLNMVAVIDVSQADPALLAQTRRRKKGKKKRGPTRNNKTTAMRFHHDPIAPVREELPEETVEAATEEPPERSPPEEPPVTTILPKPNIALRHRSVAERDSPLPHRGPAPSLAKRSVGRLNSQEGNHAPRYHRGHVDPRVTARPSTKAQHPAMQLGGRGFTPGASSIGASSIGASSIGSSMTMSSLRMPDFFAGRRHGRQHAGSVFFHHQQPLNPVSTRNKYNQAFEEDPSGKIIPKKMLSKLEVESPDHPFFRRIWLVRHTLDVNSLLLKPHVREMLRRNQGFWPKELNNYESIRASLEFDQILISISGTSNADANSVYAQHVYHMWDVNVGYRFVNALYRDPIDGNLKVDQNLINDVMEQAGGGGEPLNGELDDANFQEIMVL